MNCGQEWVEIGAGGILQEYRHFSPFSRLLCVTSDARIFRDGPSDFSVRNLNGAFYRLKIPEVAYQSTVACPDGFLAVDESGRVFKYRVSRDEIAKPAIQYECETLEEFHESMLGIEWFGESVSVHGINDRDGWLRTRGVAIDYAPEDVEIVSKSIGIRRVQHSWNDWRWELVTLGETVEVVASGSENSVEAFSLGDDPSRIILETNNNQSLLLVYLNGSRAEESPRTNKVDAHFVLFWGGAEYLVDNGLRHVESFWERSV